MWGRGVSADTQFTITRDWADTCQDQGLWLVIIQPLIGRRRLTMITCGVLLHRTQVGQDYFSPHQGCYYTSRALRSLLPGSRSDECLWKEEFGFHSAAPRGGPWPGWCSPGLRVWGFLLDWVWFCSTSGGLWGQKYVKIIIMQPQIKSPRFINTSSLSGNYWDQHQLPPRKMYESNIFLERFFVVSIKQVGFLFIRTNIFTLALQQNRFFGPGLYFDLFNICSQTKSILPFISYFDIFCFWWT